MMMMITKTCQSTSWILMKRFVIVYFLHAHTHNHPVDADNWLTSSCLDKQTNQDFEPVVDDKLLFLSLFYTLNLCQYAAQKITRIY